MCAPPLAPLPTHRCSPLSPSPGGRGGQPAAGRVPGPVSGGHGPAGGLGSHRQPPGPRAVAVSRPAQKRGPGGMHGGGATPHDVRTMRTPHALSPARILTSPHACAGCAPESTGPITPPSWAPSCACTRRAPGPRALPSPLESSGHERAPAPSSIHLLPLFTHHTHCPPSLPVPCLEGRLDPPAPPTLSNSPGFSPPTDVCF